MVAAFLAADAADNLVGLELDEDLDEVVRRQSILPRDLLHAGGHVAMMPAGQGQDSARGVIAFDGQLQASRRVPPWGTGAKPGRGSWGVPVSRGQFPAGDDWRGTGGGSRQGRPFTAYLASAGFSERTFDQWERKDIFSLANGFSELPSHGRRAVAIWNVTSRKMIDQAMNEPG